MNLIKMKTLTLLYFIVLISHSVFANINIRKFIQGADQLLQQEVKDGKVDYQNIKENFKSIDALYQQIGTISLKNASEQEKKAFYINAYNMIVIHQITQYYPLKSPMDKSGFFDQVKHKVAGEHMTLNALEINKIIKPYHDPRIHFVLACAAKGCPPLASFAYTPEKLDEQLTTRTKLSLNNPGFIKVNKSKKQVEISKIFDWYQKDFTQDGKSVLQFINQYREAAIPADYQMSYYEYDWRLNDQKQ